MKKEETATAMAPAAEAKAPAPPPAKNLTKPAPVFVEAEKMFERLAQITKETTQRAFEYFQKRGGEWGREFDDWFRAESEILRPVPVEITDKDSKLYVNASVAGFKPEEIEISVKDNLLTISGTTEKREEKKEENLVYTDFASNRFFRQMTLPAIVDASKVEAKLDDGILRIVLPKMAAQEAKHIAVAAG
jgi:HSP20 family protein